MPSGTLQKEERLIELQQLVMEGQLTHRQIAQKIGVRPETVSRWLKEHRQRLMKDLRERQQSVLETLITESERDVNRMGQAIDTLQVRLGDAHPQVLELLRSKERLQKNLAKLMGVEHENPHLKRQPRRRTLPVRPLWM
jgi:transposase-like protein